MALRYRWVIALLLHAPRAVFEGSKSNWPCATFYKKVTVTFKVTVTYFKVLALDVPPHHQ